MKVYAWNLKKSLSLAISDPLECFTTNLFNCLNIVYCLFDFQID